MTEKEDDLKQEATELTDHLKHDKKWQALRDAILGKGLRMDEVALGGFYEDEVDNEYGLVVTKAGQAFQFERSTLEGSRGFKVWQQVKMESVRDEYPAAIHALTLARGGTLE